MRGLLLVSALAFIHGTAVASELVKVDVAALRCEGATVLGYQDSREQLTLVPQVSSALRHSFATDARTYGRGCQSEKIAQIKGATDRSGFAIAEALVDGETKYFEPVVVDGYCIYGEVSERLTLDFRNGLVLESNVVQPVREKADPVVGCAP